jgi:Family of unknown function (DUF6228)
MASVDAACAGRAMEGLHFQNVVRGQDGAIWSVEVCLRVPRLEARSRVDAHYAAGFDDLVAFFRQLAADWRGWDGERVYESIGHDLRLTATHDGYVRLAVQLWQESGRLGWLAVAVISLEPGEEMTQVAEDMAALLSSGP